MHKSSYNIDLKGGEFMDEENLTQNDNNTTPTQEPEQKGMSIASLILGIISLVLFCFWYLSLPCAIIAIILGVMGRKKGGKGMATAGIVLGAIAIVLVVVILILAAVGIGVLSSMDPNSLNTMYY